MFFIRSLIFFNILFCYYAHDPIMMGLAGSYNTSAQGYHCVGINPANLAFEDDNYIGLFGMNLNLSNNLFSYELKPKPDILLLSRNICFKPNEFRISEL